MGRIKPQSNWQQIRNNEKVALKMMNEGNFKKAKFFVNNLLKINPEYPDAYYLLSVIQRRSNEPKLLQSSSFKQSSQNQGRQENNQDQNDIEMAKNTKKQIPDISLHEQKTANKLRDIDVSGVKRQIDYEKRHGKMEQENPKQYSLKDDGKKNKSKRLRNYALYLNGSTNKAYNNKTSKYQNNQLNCQQRAIRTLLIKSNQIASQQNSIKKMKGAQKIKSMLDYWLTSLELYQSIGDKSGAKALAQTIIENFHTYRNRMPDIFTQTFIIRFGVKFYDIGLYSHAWEFFKFVTDSWRRDFMNRNNLAILSYILGRYEEGKKLLQESQNGNRGYPITSYIRSFISAQTNDLEGALISIRYCISKRPQTAFYHFKQICILSQFFRCDGKVQQREGQDYGNTKRQKQLIKELQICLEKAVDIMENDKNDDTILLPERSKDSAKQAILFIKYFYLKLGIIAFNDEMFQQYFSIFNYFLIVGRNDKLKMSQKLKKQEENIRKMHNMEIIGMENEQQSEQEGIERQIRDINEEDSSSSIGD